MRAIQTNSNAERPHLDLEPFCEMSLSQPYIYYERLRERAPVLWLAHHGIFAVAHYKDVSEALKDWRTFCSARGVGLADFAKERRWRMPITILANG